MVENLILWIAFFGILKTFQPQHFYHLHTRMRSQGVSQESWRCCVIFLRVWACLLLFQYLLWHLKLSVRWIDQLPVSLPKSKKLARRQSSQRQATTVTLRRTVLASESMPLSTVLQRQSATSCRCFSSLLKHPVPESVKAKIKSANM